MSFSRLCDKKRKVIAFAAGCKVFSLAGRFFDIGPFKYKSEKDLWFLI